MSDLTPKYFYLQIFKSFATWLYSIFTVHDVFIWEGSPPLALPARSIC